MVHMVLIMVNVMCGNHFGVNIHCFTHSLFLTLLRVRYSFY